MDQGSKHSDAAPGGSAPWRPTETLLEISEQAPELVNELIDAFESDTNARLQRLRDSLAEGDVMGLRKEAHTLKGSASQMGVDVMASLCREIEAAAMRGQLVVLAERIAALESRFTEVSRSMAEYSRQG
jgi:HPt (histidine-containing phosphotransfer) domain-containing protein